MNQLNNRVASVLAALAGLEQDEVTPETTIESLALDSLDFVELTLTLERELGVHIDPEGFVGIVTVQDAVDVIEATGTLAA